MSYIKAIIALFAIAAMIALVLGMITITTASAQAADCPCGPACECQAVNDALGNVAGNILKAECDCMGKVLQRVTHPLQVDPSAGGLRKGQERRWSRRAARGK